jgi:hypothetical protein
MGKKSNVSGWHERFKDGRDNVEGERSACPRSHKTDENDEKVRYLVQSY